MILDNSVLIKRTNTNKKFYESKGYNINDEYLNINIEDLPPSSHVTINVKCEYCDEIKKVQYKNYIIQINRGGDYCCSKCKTKKTKKNNIEKYGVHSPLCLTETQEKMKKLLYEKYGVNNALESIEILENMKNTLLSKYNVDNVSKLNTIKKKKNETLSKTWINRINKKNKYNIISGDYDKQILNIECDNGNKHNFDIPYNLFHTRIQFNSILCTKCNKVGRSTFNVENKIIKFISDNYNGEIIKNSRNIIKPYELDIYLPELNLAIELNGLKWHDENHMDKNYHLMKYDLCKERNITLIQFFEDEWVYKYEIVKSMILNRIKKTPNKIYARKCIIKQIEFKETKEFMIKNHIQGYASSKYNFGLIYNNEIVSLITFGNRKISGNKLFELIRYGSLLNTNVIGGFSKLLKYSIDKLNIKELITYANKSYSDGNLYEGNGFIYVCDTKPDYYYIISKIRKHRYSFRKDILIKQGYDSNKSEKEIMKERGIPRIYDSGNKKYILKNNI